MPILLAGAGTYSHPYKVDFVDDVYVKSLVLINYDVLFGGAAYVYIYICIHIWRCVYTARLSVSAF